MNYEKKETKLEIKTPFILCTPESGSANKPLVVILHGYGKTADEYSTLPARINESDFNYLIPQAPFRMLNRNGENGSGWIFTKLGGDDKESRIQSTRYIKELVKKTVEETESDEKQVVLMAFSQASFVGLNAALKYPDLFSKVILQGGWVNQSVLSPQLEQGLNGMSFFIQHGNQDQEVPIENGIQMAELLSKHDGIVDFKEYRCGHVYIQEILDDVNRYLLKKEILGLRRI